MNARLAVGWFAMLAAAMLVIADLAVLKQGNWALPVVPCRTRTSRCGVRVTIVVMQHYAVLFSPHTAVEKRTGSDVGIFAAARVRPRPHQSVRLSPPIASTNAYMQTIPRPAGSALKHHRTRRSASPLACNPLTRTGFRLHATLSPAQHGESPECDCDSPRLC